MNFALIDPFDLGLEGHKTIGLFLVSWVTLGYSIPVGPRARQITVFRKTKQICFRARLLIYRIHLTHVHSSSHFNLSDLRTSECITTPQNKKKN